MSRLLSTLATIWRLARPYFFSEDRFAGRVLLGAVIAIELSIVAINVILNWWNARFYNALQERSWDTFVSELIFFCVIATIYIVLAVYQLYLNQWLQIRWRKWMTRQYLDHWLTGGNHYRMQLLGDAADNPDQRIAEDIKQFIDGGILPIGLGLLNATVTLGSFVVILWTLSAAAPLYLFGTDWAIPGYLVWAALLYAVVGTVLTHLVGWPLISLNFRQQRFEADFRFNLVRARESSEQIALLAGEAAESDHLLDRFGRLVANWLLIMQRTKRLTFLTAGYAQVATIFPFIVASPAYFAGAIQLGGLMQTASAFGSVQTALSFFITVYRQLAEWQAVVERLDGFNAAVTAAQAAARTPPAIEISARAALASEASGQRGHSVEVRAHSASEDARERAGDTRPEPGSSARAGADKVEIDDLLVRLPQGTPLVAADGVAIAAGERVLVTGPSGAGKSTLFRALAGAWPFGEGHIVVPAGAKVMTLPQRPYFPIGTLAAAVTYPAEPGTFATEKLAEVIGAVGLPALAGRLAEEAHWNRMLSLGEQQRLGIARAILQAPDYLLLDEATASLDEPAEAALYRLLQERLSATTIVSIGHRATLAAFHRRRLALVRDGDIHRVREVAAEPAIG